MISVFAQIVQRLPGHLIDSLAEGQKVRARGFSYSSQLYTLMLGQFLHAFSLNELVDISEVHRAELSRIRGITPAKRNTFSNATARATRRSPRASTGRCATISAAAPRGSGACATGGRSPGSGPGASTRSTHPSYRFRSTA